MKNKTQTQWAVDKLLNEGRVSRNTALQNYISRLGAIINDLNNDGWSITGNYEKTPHGKDYVYTLVSSPYEKEEFFVPALNKTITRYVKKK